MQKSLKMLTSVLWVLVCFGGGTYGINWLFINQLDFTAKVFPALIALWVIVTFIGRLLIDWIFGE